VDGLRGIARKEDGVRWGGVDEAPYRLTGPLVRLGRVARLEPRPPVHVAVPAAEPVDLTDHPSERGRAGGVVEVDVAPLASQDRNPDRGSHREPETVLDGHVTARPAVGGGSP